MTDDEERHADEVNIAFLLGAEWQKERSDSAWKGIHEGAVLALQARIEQLEAALREKNSPLYTVVRVHKGEIPDGEIYGVPIMCDGERIFPRLGDEYDLYVARTVFDRAAQAIARAALEGKKDE